MKHVLRSGLAVAIILVMVASTFAISPTTVNASSTIYIKPDGSVEPASAPIIRHGDGYKLSANVYDSIYIQRSGIKLVGGGYTIQGSGTGFGVYLRSVSNVMLKNLIVKGFDQGIELERSDHNTILRSKVTGCATNGIRLSGSSNNTIAKNEVYSNSWDGIVLKDYSYTPYSDNLITGNKVHDNYVVGIRLRGHHEHERNIVTKNTVYGQQFGIEIGGNTDVRVEKNLVYQNEYKGIDSVGPINGMVIGNTIRDNDDIGLGIRAGWWTKYEQNMILNNRIGIDFMRGATGQNVIQHNWIQGNEIGVHLYDNAQNNIITLNTITQNDLGAHVEYTTSDNKLHHNNFIGNTVQLVNEGYNNIWDDGRPRTEGNYWSDYTGEDTNRDGVGDTEVPHQFVDYYPLMTACKHRKVHIIRMR